MKFTYTICICDGGQVVEKRIIDDLCISYEKDGEVQTWWNMETQFSDSKRINIPISHSFESADDIKITRSCTLYPPSGSTTESESSSNVVIINSLYDCCQNHCNSFFSLDPFHDDDMHSLEVQEDIIKVNFDIPCGGGDMECDDAECKCPGVIHGVSVRFDAVVIRNDTLLDGASLGKLEPRQLTEYQKKYLSRDHSSILDLIHDKILKKTFWIRITLSYENEIETYGIMAIDTKGFTLSTRELEKLQNLNDMINETKLLFWMEDNQGGAVDCFAAPEKLGRGRHASIFWSDGLHNEFDWMEIDRQLKR